MKIPIFLVVFILTSTCALVLLSPGTSKGAITPLGYSLNGNQELVADPDRPLVYAADTDGHEVHVLNATTEAELWNVSVGASPLSLDISSDGRYLYVAVSEASSIAIVDLQTRTVSRTIPLTFHPLSIRIGLSGRLYLTDIPEPYQSGGPKVVDETSGTLLENYSGFGNCVLEMSPNKTVILMMQLGTSPTPLYKYSCAGPNLVLLDEDNHDLGENARQMAVDWTNETVYLVSGYPYGIEIVSLASMDRLGMISAEAYPSGVAVSPDHKTVFCTTMGGKDQLWAFYASNRTLMAKYKLRESSLEIDQSAYAAIAAPPLAGSVVAIGKPVQFLNLSKPMLFPGFPRVEENVGYNYSGNIVSDIFVGVPPCNITSGVVELDGTTLASFIEDQALVGVLPGPITDGGNHTAHALLVWDGGSVNISWTFSASESEHIVSVMPAMGLEVNYVPENITVVLDLGYPERTMAGTYIGLNDAFAPYDFENGVITIHTQYQGTNLVLPGLNEVVLDLNFVHVDYMVPIYTSISLTWNFSIKDVAVSPSSEGLAWHNLSSGVSVRLPVSWTIMDNVTVGGVFFDTQALGPINGTTRTVISLQSGTDPNATEDEQYLSSFVDEFVTKMQTGNNSVYVVEGPSYREISGHAAVVFAIRWANEPLVQKIAVIIDQSTSRYWILIMTVEASRYFDENPMFEGVISSFSTPIGQVIPEFSSQMVFLGVMVTMIAVVVGLRRFSKH